MARQWYFFNVHMVSGESTTFLCSHNKGEKALFVYVAYVVREGEHYLLCLYCKRESTTCYVHMVKEWEHYLLCSHGKGGRALLVILTWQGRDSTTCYSHMVREGEHFLCSHGKRGKTLLVMFKWLGRENTTCFVHMAREGHYHLLCSHG